jgi:integrase/recombinase XerC
MSVFGNNPPATPKPIERDMVDFMLDRQARNLTPKTLAWYNAGLDKLGAFLATQGIDRTEEVKPADLRRFLVHLQAAGHNAGGASGIYGACKAFFRWYGAEYAPAGWLNPVARVQSPKRPDELLDPIDLKDFDAMLATCERSFAGDRDKAVLLVLLDSGVRHAELTALVIGDVDMMSGALLVRSGKGRKWRQVFVGVTTRRALSAYLRRRQNVTPQAALWVTLSGRPLSEHYQQK